MNVKKCDRCGKIIEKGINDKDASALLIFNIDDVYDGYTYTAVQAKADLCESCTKDLAKWLKGM